MGNGGTVWTACIYVDYICYGRRLWGMEGPYGLHVFMWTTYVTVDVFKICWPTDSGAEQISTLMLMQYI